MGPFWNSVKWGYRCKFTRNWGRCLDFNIFGCFSPLPSPRFFPCKLLGISVTRPYCSVGSDCFSLYCVVYSQPENIMLLKPKSKKIKLIDFGLSRKLKEDEIVKEMMGTPEFVGKCNNTLVPITTALVTMSTQLKQVDSFAPKSLTAMSNVWLQWAPAYNDPTRISCNWWFHCQRDFFVIEWTAFIVSSDPKYRSFHLNGVRKFKIK